MGGPCWKALVLPIVPIVTWAPGGKCGANLLNTSSASRWAFAPLIAMSQSWQTGSDVCGRPQERGPGEVCASARDVPLPCGVKSPGVWELRRSRLVYRSILRGGVMDDRSFEALVDIAQGTLGSEPERVTAINSLTSHETRGSVEALLQIAERQDEPEAILRAAGTALGMLQDRGVEVSEWDLRNLGAVAGDAFFDAS
jgi:hypothetical protein